MDINKKLTELIDGVNNGDIDTLADLQRELIYLRSEIQALHIHDVVERSEQLPNREEMDKNWETLRDCGLDKKLDKYD
jgi:hypothetical protein